MSSEQRVLGEAYKKQKQNSFALRCVGKISGYVYRATRTRRFQSHTSIFHRAFRDNYSTRLQESPRNDALFCDKSFEDTERNRSTQSTAPRRHVVCDGKGTARRKICTRTREACDSLYRFKSQRAAPAKKKGEVSMKKGGCHLKKGEIRIELSV